MQPRTDEVNTKDWVEASRGIVVRAYIESRTATSTLPGRPIALGDVLRDLKETSVPLVRKPVMPEDLEIELQAWDSLSDEALRNFEQELD